MNFNYYVNIFNEEDLNFLFLILESYNIETKSQTKRVKDAAETCLYSHKSVMVCIENNRLSFNSTNFLEYVKRKNLIEIKIEEIKNSW